MAAGTTIQHKRKAGAFVGGELAAGEMGVDTTNAVVYFSDDGSTVGSLLGTITGAVIWYADDAAPAGFLKANGATISRTTYADLFAVIGTTFGAGDGSTTFVIPDLRGEFVRGWDDSRGIDSGRAFGSAQADEFKTHTHPQQSSTILFDVGAAVNVSGSTTRNAGGTTQATGGAETRPRNIALLACIKY